MFLKEIRSDDLVTRTNDWFFQNIFREYNAIENTPNKRKLHFFKAKFCIINTLFGSFFTLATEVL
jgi:hypothetical protein